jgi:hypothetical protein
MLNPQQYFGSDNKVTTITKMEQWYILYFWSRTCQMFQFPFKEYSSGEASKEASKTSFLFQKKFMDIH